MMKRQFVLLLCFFMSAVIAKAQYTSENAKAIKLYNEAKNHFTFQRFDDAEKRLLQAIKKDESFVEAYYLLAGVYRQKNLLEEDLSLLEKCAQINGERYPMTFFFWATEMLDLGRYNGAYEQLALLKKKEHLFKASQKDQINYYLKKSKFGLDQVNSPVAFEPKNMGANINTENDDYHPALTADETMFVVTSNVPTQSQAYGKILQEDFFISFKSTDTSWTKREEFGDPLNTPRNEGTLSMTADGSMFFFSACDRPKGFGSCDIYYTERIGTKWRSPKNLGQPVNTRYWEAQPSVTADGRTIYFVSNRPGGYGGSDIWVTSLNQFGEWTEPRNLGSIINTKKAENNPFIHADNHTFYFCSEGHVGMGGSDIFVTRKNTESDWDEPVNLGYPINTFADETGIIVSAQGQKAYFASDAYGGFGGLDIYEFSLPKTVQPQAVSYVTGVVYDRKTGKSVSSVIELVDIETSELVAQSFSDPMTGRYLVILPAGRKYVFNASKSGYLFYSESFNVPAQQEDALEMDIPLSPIASGERMVLNNVFFDTDSYHLKNESKIELDRLIFFMRQNPKVEIEIGGHTDDRGNRMANATLSENRAKAVFDYIVSENIDPDRMTYKGYGSEQPVVENTSEENRAQNRRTEIKIVAH